MKNLSISKYDVNYHLKRNSKFYFCFIAVIVISIIIATIIIISSDSYLNLLVSNNKILYNFINGSVKLNEVFWNRLISFLIPALFILILGLNFYLCLFSYLIVGYQFIIFVMTIYAVIDLYGFAGVINSITLIIPLNLLFFVNLIFFAVVCLERSRRAVRYRYFQEGYNKCFFIKISISFFVMLLLALTVSIIYPLILKSAIFLIY